MIWWTALYFGQKMQIILYNTFTIYAWALSTLNNTLRKHYRIELMKWAIDTPHEFFKLFKKFCFINDEQIRFDIFSILMCVIFNEKSSIFLEFLCKT